MALSNSLRSASKQLLASSSSSSSSSSASAASLLPKSVSREIHSTGVKRTGGGHAHGHDEPFYIHAKHMYNLDRMKHQALKMSLGVFTAFSIGVGVPIYAVIFQQKKTASG